VPVTLSPELAAELRAAERCRLATGGAFDPGVGALVAAWGLRTGGRRPSAGEVAAARAAGGAALLALGPGDVAVRRHPGLLLEEGGFGKGAGLDRAIAALAASPGVRHAFLDLGGQVTVLGHGWTVEVADPRRRDRAVLELSLASDGDPGGGTVSVATSGNSERGIEVDGSRRSHLLDPRTGEPARDFGSLTVVVEGAVAAGSVGGGLWADCLATGLYVLGPDAALAWAAARPGVEVLVVETHPHGLQARATPGLAGRLHPRAEELRLEFVSDHP
jgi:thiamine biosynthesis lipoprotein